MYNTMQLLMDLHILMAISILDHYQAGSDNTPYSSIYSTDGTPIKAKQEIILVYKDHFCSWWNPNYYYQFGRLGPIPMSGD
jgi:hypothetical protein